MAKRIFTSSGKTCDCVFSPLRDKKQTIPGLAMTPSQVKQLADRGLPVSTPNMQEFYSDSTGWSVEPMFQRGADICQLWEMEQIAQAKVLSARRKDIARYGK